MTTNIKLIPALSAIMVAFALSAEAIPYTLTSAMATKTDGNTTSSFYEVTGVAAESGTAVALYSAAVGGDENSGWWVEISFGNNPQPVLTSAFLKAGNENAGGGYLWWDSADLAAFNAGSFTSIILQNSGSGGLMNKPGNAYLGTSHAGLNGEPGTRVPDGGATLGLLGLGLIGFGALRRFVA